jgi:hypothetical protein
MCKCGERDSDMVLTAYTPSQNQGESVCLLPHTPRRFPLRSGQLSTRHEHKRASYLMLVQLSHTLIFQSRPVTAFVDSRAYTHPLCVRYTPLR